MLEKLLHLIYRKDEPEIENRLFCVSVFISIVICVLSLIINIQLSLHWILHFIVGLSIVMLSWLYIMARKFKTYLKGPFIATALIVLSGTWLYNEGPNGSINYVYMLCVVLFLSIIKRKYHLAIILLVLFNMVLLYSAYFLYPEIVHPYQDENSKQYDILVTFIYSIVFVALTLSAIRLSGEKDRAKVLEQKDEIDQLHEELLNNRQFSDNIDRTVFINENDFRSFFKQHYILGNKKLCGNSFCMSIKHPKNEHCLYFLIIDCKGPKIQQTVLSLLFKSLLCHIVLEEPNISASKLIEKLRISLLKTLDKNNGNYSILNSINIVSCKIDKKSGVFEFSGLNKSLFLIRDNQVIEYPGDMGVYLRDDEVFSKVKSTIIELQGNDNFIIAFGTEDQLSEGVDTNISKSMIEGMLANISVKDINENMEAMKIEMIDIFEKQEQTKDMLVFSFIPV